MSILNDTSAEPRIPGMFPCDTPLNNCLCGGKAVWVLTGHTSSPIPRIIPTCTQCKKTGQVAASIDTKRSAEVWNMLNKHKQGKKNMKPTKKKKK